MFTAPPLILAEEFFVPRKHNIMMSKSSGETAMRIIFVRHGEPDYDNDILTPNGVRQAESTSARIKDEGISAVLFSHLLGLPFPFVLTSLPYGVCSVSIFDLTPQSKDIVVPRLELFNEMGHLGDVRQEKLRFEK